MVTAQLDMGQVAGPIRIVNMIDDQYQAAVVAAAQPEIGVGIVILSVVLNMTNLAAVISANLGVFNLLPLPALDGGRVVFLTLEAIRRKPISPEREGMVHLAGFILLMILAVFIAYNDIMNIL
jgi:regulator of sigma E protease